MIKLQTPRGLSVNVPETRDEDQSPHFEVHDRRAIAAYYAANGYVIVRGVVPQGDCDRIRLLWEQEVKPDCGFMYRQATAKAERHERNAQGWIMNPILNLQSVDPTKFGRFRDFAIGQILTSPQLASVFETLLGESPKIVQSMYFEGNSATWEHQDSYYLDSEDVGRMGAAWIALEDISATAGRFFVCPESSKIAPEEHGPANNIASNHEVYIQSVVSLVRDLGLEIRAPMMEMGDVLFWNSWTIHGSLDSQDDVHSRSSITCHAIPASHRFLQLQSRLFDLETSTVNGVQVYQPKNLAKMKNRVVFWVESHFPGLFYFIKSMAIKFVVSSK